MASQEDIDAQQRLLSQQRRTLAIYLEQLAQLSSNHAPPGTINGAYEACSHIRQITDLLAEWGVAVESDANDELCQHTDFQAFLKALQGRRIAAPGGKRAATAPVKKQVQDSPPEVAPTAPTPIVVEPIKITRVVTEEVTQPRNDGTEGSALYKVPLQLSRTPSADWSRLFVETWDRPPQSTLMHRRGIARVIGDRVILDGTTIEEVAQYHRDTLKLVVRRVNELVIEHQRKKQQQQDLEQKRRQEHEAAVREAADQLNFD
jgi:hypothetical protein